MKAILTFECEHFTYDESGKPFCKIKRFPFVEEEGGVTTEEECRDCISEKLTDTFNCDVGIADLTNGVKLELEW